jgi:Arc/MetJ-type ribon-helix-helix transcriptional regulator
MRKKISISINEDKIKKIEELLKSSRFRSKPYIIEYSLEKFLEGEFEDGR